MKIAVSVHGRFHGFDLARELNRKGALAGLITTYPGFAVRKHLGRIEGLSTIPRLEIKRRICQRFATFSGNIDAQLAESFGHFAAQNIPTCDIFVGWSSATLEVIPIAHERGIPVVLERGSSHILHQTELLKKLHARHGRKFKHTSPRVIERELAEYEAADAIAVPSSYAADTFRSHGVPKEKIRVNPYGVDIKQFFPAKYNNAAKPTILFVGQVGIRKGVPELLAAFAGLSIDAQLRLIGPLEPAYKEPRQSRVDFLGPIPISALPDQYRSARIFCLPSWEEGFPLVVLQAMASGLPIVATDATGVADIVTPGVEGEIVPAGDIESLSNALGGLLDDPKRAQKMGAAGRDRVMNGFDWSSYGERAYKIYAELASK